MCEPGLAKIRTQLQLTDPICDPVGGVGFGHTKSIMHRSGHGQGFVNCQGKPVGLVKISKILSEIVQFWFNITKNTGISKDPTAINPLS